MDKQSVLNRYPQLCKVAEHRRLDDDLDAALNAATDTNDRKGLWKAYWAGRFSANELTFWLCVHEFGDRADHTADEIETNLATLEREVGFDAVRSAYQKKLLARQPSQFLDVRYEIAAAAAAAKFLDPGTLKLESGIGGAAKNSDVGGMRRAIPVRIEVRVVHDCWPPSIDATAEAIVLNANIPAGYRASLRFPIDPAIAETVKGIIESLYAVYAVAHIDISKPINGAGNRFWYNDVAEAFDANDDSCPLSAVTFEAEREVRLVTPPVFTRSTVDPQERDYFSNPSGVQVFSGEFADKRTYENRPLSTRIAQAVEGKARQCELGVCNVVVLGTPSPITDSAVNDALFGVAAATFVRGENGFESAGLIRKPSGMFVPAKFSENTANLIDPYRIISAVWHVRLGTSAPQSRVLLNPNAAVELESQDAQALADTLPRQA